MYRKFNWPLYLVLLMVMTSIVIGALYGYRSIGAPWPLNLVKLHDWQELTGSLVGALVGAGVAIYLFWRTHITTKESARIEHVELLQRSIAAALVNLNEIDGTLHRFTSGNLDSLIQSVEAHPATAPAISTAFIPLSYVVNISDSLLRTSSGSGYVDFLTIQLVNRSRGFEKIIEDLDRQFERTLSINKEIALSGMNPSHGVPNRAFLDNLNSFKKDLLQDQTFNNNIPIYALDLLRAQVAVRTLQERGLHWWRRELSHLGGSRMPENMRAYFAEEVNARVEQCSKEFTSPLIKESI